MLILLGRNTIVSTDLVKIQPLRCYTYGDQDFPNGKKVFVPIEALILKKHQTTVLKTRVEIRKYEKLSVKKYVNK